MIKLHIISTSRADFGILKEFIKKIKLDKRFKSKFIVSGSHLSKNYGYSIKEIILEKIRIDKKITIECKASESSDLLNDINKINQNYTKYISSNKPDIVIVFGDRYEMLPFALTAYLHGVPIAHIHGGEVTQGSLDDGIRNAITKLSNIHFVSNAVHKKRVEQMGEERQKVINIGYLSHETIRKTKLVSKKKFEKYFKINFMKNIVVINLYAETAIIKKFNVQFLKKLSKFLSGLKNTSLIFTKPGSDVDNLKIYNFFLKSFKNKNNCFFFKSLGSKKYLSLLNFSNIMIGNSSSGILDMPFFLKPSINIGQRQFGREKFYSVIDCNYNIHEFKKKYKKVMTKRFLEKIKINNKIDKKKIEPSEKMISKLLNLDFKSLNPKKFNDIK